MQIAVLSAMSNAKLTENRTKPLCTYRATRSEKGIRQDSFNGDELARKVTILVRGQPDVSFPVQ